MIAWATWEWIIGGAIVFLYVQSRFSDPRYKYKSLMTIDRYYFALFSYFLLIGLLFVLLSGSISLSPGIINVLTNGASREFEKLPSPLISALLLTVLLPNFPLLKKADEALREWIQKMANLPREIRYLSSSLRSSYLRVSDDLKHKVLSGLADFDQADLRFKPDNSLNHEWTRIASLFIQIKSWKEEHKERYQKYLQAHMEQYNVIASKYTQLRAQALNCFRCHRMQNNPSSGNPAAVTVMRECEKNFKLQADELLNQICDFIAGAVLCCEVKKTEREREIKNMGFVDVTIPKATLNIEEILIIVMMVFLTMLVGMKIVNARVAADNTQVLFISCMVSIIYGCSVWAAIYPKTKPKWHFADRSRLGQWPMRGYLLSGIIAVVLASLVSLTFKYLLLSDFEAALENIYRRYPWFLMSFVTAAVTAWQIDWRPPENKRSAKLFSVAQGMVVSGILGLTVLLVYDMLKEVDPNPTASSLSSVLYRSLVIGFAIGYFVPQWYRQRKAGQQDQETGTTIESMAEAH